MGLFSGIVDTLFGGEDTTSQDYQIAANERAQDMIERNTAQARRDAMAISPMADRNRNLGFQAAADIMGQATPQQLGLQQQGNVGAQASLLAGMPQFQNAIMGNAVDYSQFQPRTLSYDPSFLSGVQIPQFETIADLDLSTPEEKQAAQQQQALTTLAQALGGAGNFNQGGQAFLGSDPATGEGAAQTEIARNFANNFGMMTPEVQTAMSVIGSLGGGPVMGLGSRFSNLNAMNAAQQATQATGVDTPTTGFWDAVFDPRSFKTQAQQAIMQANLAEYGRGASNYSGGTLDKEMGRDRAGTGPSAGSSSNRGSGGFAASY